MDFDLHAPVWYAVSVIYGEAGEDTAPPAEVDDIGCRAAGYSKRCGLVLFQSAGRVGAASP